MLGGRILGHRPVVAVERDPWRCQVLRERAPDWWPGVHVHEGDLRLWDPSEFAGRVDLVDAGFPCQPHSLAGKQLGGADERDLWPDVARCIRVLGARFVFLENVPGLVSSGYVARVLGDLAALGFDAEWAVLGARDVGAPHIRDRWWCLGWRADADGGGRERRTEPHQRPEAGQQAPQRDDAGRLRAPVADSDRKRRDEGTDDLRRRQHVAVRSGEDMADANDLRREERRQPEPGPAQPRERGPQWAGWWSTEPDVGRVVDGLATRPAHRHRRAAIAALGDGQVPLCHATAFALLWRRAFGTDYRGGAVA